MKFLSVILLCVLVSLSCAQSQSGNDVLQNAIKELPSCALQCTLSTVGASTCELTNVDCIKHNQKLLSDLTVCVKSTCRIKDALTARKFLQELMGAPVRDKTRVGTFTTLILGSIAALAFILRVFARLPFFGTTWGVDDWVMTAAIIVVIPLTICAYLLNELGLGKDMYVVPFDNITKILEIFYITELLYLTSIGLTKISVLLFYLRIFPDKSLRRMIYFTIVLCVLYIISFGTATALQCIPIRIAWERWDGEHRGKCINLNVDAWASAAVNIALDLIVMGLPMRMLTNLLMSPLRKLGIMVMFLGGGFITIVSILRLKYLVQFAHTENVTWDYLPIGYWSAIEADVGVVIACLPAIRSLQSSIRNRVFPKTPTKSGSYYADGTRISSKRTGQQSANSRTWASKADDTVDFVRLDEFELVNKGDGKNGDGLGSKARAVTPSSDTLPLTFGSNILVQTAYSVDRDAGCVYETTSEEDLEQNRRF